MKANVDSENHQINNQTPRIIAVALLALALLALALTGCTSAPAPAGSNLAGFAGDYTLVSVDGKNVPCVVSHEGANLMVKSGLFTINTNGACRSQTVFCIVGGRDVHRVVDATYTVSGTELTMHWKGAGWTRGAVNGNIFTMNNEGMVFAYRK